MEKVVSRENDYDERITVKCTEKRNTGRRNRMKHEDWTKAVTEKNIRLGYTPKQKEKEQEKGSETKNDKFQGS